ICRNEGASLRPADNLKIDWRRKMHFPPSSREIGIKLVLLVLLLACDLNLSYSAAVRATQEINSLVDQQYDSLFQLYRHLTYDHPLAPYLTKGIEPEFFQSYPPQLATVIQAPKATLIHRCLTTATSFGSTNAC